MKAILYKVYVADSAIDSAHGLIYQINEIFIPEYNISINSKFIYTTNKDRYKNAEKIKEVNIDKPTADIFKLYLKSQKISINTGNDLLKKFFKEDESKK